MKLYESRIEAHQQYEGELNPVLVEFGTDKAELKRRQAAAALTVAPEEAWTFDEASGEATVSVDGVDYIAFVRRINLVC